MTSQEFLEILGFKSKNGTLYQKEYNLHNYTIKADTAKGRIHYRSDDQTTVERQEDGQIQLGDKTTSNFSAPENYVVLECVDRLLRKGYNPNDIHLERRYPSGRGASGGKSDVCVYGKDGKSLLVIECKTWGTEFEKEKKKMDEHGGQVFAYLANDQNAKFLVLYASKPNATITTDDKFDYENLIIQVKDREEDLKKSTKQIEEENIKLYREAKNKAELFEVWKESFNKYFHFNGIFDEDANAYSLELKALKKKNLKSLEDSQGLFNKFAEILRHNNISDNANAFNKILSLFLCKLVDEEKNDEDVLAFQVKEDEEYEHIIDRLQALYQKGMKKLDEEIVYYSEKDLHEIIKLYPKQTPIEKVESIFRELKYYTNNEFAFKEVHNKNLFIQNGRVLTEVIKLIQNFQFRFTSKQQVLGDFFELMLNHGVKQSEGQFFTPIPIVRYIILSLGVENIIHSKIANGADEILPKILDYACGAGHFLTESVEELQNAIKKIDTTKLSVAHQNKITEYSKGTEWAKDFIFGIEKDYRLARASQIACYINGNGDANIIFGDGLEEHDKIELKKKKFDLVIANPPYSVDAFKNYLNVGKAHFELFDSLTETSDEIETVFIERTKQVLEYKGLAGLVLPTSIFESGGIYTKAREILFKYFEIKGITELGSKTFIATNVKTLIVFLKRRDDNFLKDREYITSDLFTNTNHTANIRYIDANRLLKMYVEHRNFDLADYERFLKLEINQELAETNMFVDYKTAFDDLADIKQLKARASFRHLPATEQDAALTKRFYHYCKDIEKEKFLYFMLCLTDGEMATETIENYYNFQQTVIVKTGKDIDEQKDFLGYEFSKRKRQEGIKINSYGGKLFDDSNYSNPQKANYYINQNILNQNIDTIDESLAKNVQINSLVDLIDFELIDFDKKINTETISKTNWEDVWESSDIKSLSEFAIVQKGKSITKATTTQGLIPVVAGGQQPAYFHNVSNRTKNVITVSASGAYAGFLNFWDKEIFASDCTTIQSKNELDISTELLYEILKVVQPEIYKLQRGQAQPHVYPKDISKIKIPFPSKKNQKLIMKELEALNKNKGTYLTNGIAVKDLEELLQVEKMKIIIKYSFKKETKK
ncbi:MAG: N-6 DNA methylase [Bacteroidales bacterium]